MITQLEFGQAPSIVVRPQASIVQADTICPKQACSRYSQSYSVDGSSFRSLRSSRLEQSAIWRHHTAIADRLQTTAQHSALQSLTWSLTVWLLFLICVILSLVLFVSVVKCSWSFFCLHGIVIIFVYNNNNKRTARMIDHLSYNF